ncbi:MAG: hypothetical protein LJE70_05745, partial [Chromatiaceae bacterium]|nr:hypothetical protein [Chromatiaceae bacterium]
GRPVYTGTGARELAQPAVAFRLSRVGTLVPAWRRTRALFTDRSHLPPYLALLKSGAFEERVEQVIAYLGSRDLCPFDRSIAGSIADIREVAFLFDMRGL